VMAATGDQDVESWRYGEELEALHRSLERRYAVR
jgi:hypothetical protein